MRNRIKAIFMWTMYVGFIERFSVYNRNILT